MPSFKIQGSDLRTIIRNLNKLIVQHNRQRRKRIRRAVNEAADATAIYVQAYKIPVAFRELVDSLDVTEHGGLRQPSAKVKVTAPHAEAVEHGSRPHWVPIEPLIRWVRLRGMQGLRKTKHLKAPFKGSSTHRQARSVAAMIRSMQSKTGATPVDAPTQIARAIQAAIAVRGTKPQKYMFRSVPFARDALMNHVSEAVPDGLNE